MYSPQGDEQPRHSSQKGSRYSLSHWHTLQRHWPRPLHTDPPFRQPSVDRWHWQAEPSKPGLQRHLPQRHSPRSGRQRGHRRVTPARRQPPRQLAFHSPGPKPGTCSWGSVCPSVPSTTPENSPAPPQILPS